MNSAFFMPQMCNRVALHEKCRVRNFSGPYFLAFELNTERYSVSLRTQSEYGKIRTKKTPNTDTFHGVQMFH